MEKHVFFDMDGTLVDPGEGILSSLRYFLNKKKLPIPERAVMLSWIGPPLRLTFERYFGFNERENDEAIALFQEYYAARGVRECCLYEGIVPMLHRLRANGAFLAVATAKPEIYARAILEDFGILSLFDRVTGADPREKTLFTKQDILAEALSASAVCPEETVYIGDRAADMQAARNLKMKRIGVLYGFGTEEELRSAGAQCCCRTVAELEGELLS